MAPSSLTKSRYLAGCQCALRLWWQTYDPMPPEEPSSPVLAAIHGEIRKGAQALFPGGIAVDAHRRPGETNQAATRRLLADPNVRALFGAAFATHPAEVRIDVLARTPSGISIARITSSTGGKPIYNAELILQAHLANAGGLRVTHAEVIHVDKCYVRGEEGIDWPALFGRIDVSADVLPFLAELPSSLAQMGEVLACLDPPAITCGGQCLDPSPCEFLPRCEPARPDDWVGHLPRISAPRRERLAAIGVETIAAIPADFPLSWQQGMIRDVIASKTPFVASDLSRLLAPFAPPVCYLDFEAMMPPLPLYPGTSPYQTLPCQWSLHSDRGDGVLEHQEFLASGGIDPRRDFAESLIAALAGVDGPVVVYSAYERTQLRSLAVAFPDLAGALNGIIDRLADLLPVVRNGVYFEAFDFSNSIKYVAPALAPGFGYDDLPQVSNGQLAAEACLRLAMAPPAADEAAALREALLIYCERDTLAMVEVHRALRRLAGVA